MHLNHNRITGTQGTHRLSICVFSMYVPIVVKIFAYEIFEIILNSLLVMSGKEALL